MNSVIKTFCRKHKIILNNNKPLMRIREDSADFPADKKRRNGTLRRLRERSLYKNFSASFFLNAYYQGRTELR